MTQTKDLVALLRAEGTLDSSGQFTLDPQVALEKLRAHRFTEPARFVLSWVRAAHALAASRIDVEIDANDVWLRFDGRALTAEDVEHLWSSALSQEGSETVRARAELALGVLGAFAWGAGAVKMHSGELTVSCGSNMQLERGPRTDGAAQTVLHARRSLGWDLVERFARDRQGGLPEEQVLAEACRYAAVPIFLEGRQLNVPPPEPQEVWQRAIIDDGERRGVLFLRAGDRSTLRLLKGGVEVGVFPLPFGHGSVEAIVDDPGMPLDLSQENPVEGARWEALIACVSLARWSAWFALAEQRSWPPAKKDPTHSVLLNEIYNTSNLRWLSVPGAQRYADALRVPRAVKEPLGGFRALEDGSQARPDVRLVPWQVNAPGALTLGEVLRVGQAQGVVFVSPKAIATLPANADIPVAQRPVVPLFASVGQVDLSVPENRVRYWQHLHGRRQLFGDAALPDTWREVRHEHHGYRARVAWRMGLSRGGDGARGALVLGRDGRPLAELSLPGVWGPLFAEIEGPFALPVEPGQETLETALEVIRGVLILLDAYGRLVQTHGRALWEDAPQIMESYLLAARGRWSERLLWELGLFSHGAVERALAAWDGGWGVPDAWVRARAGERPLVAHPLLAVPALRRGAWGKASLQDAQRELSVRGCLFYRPPAEDEDVPSYVWRLEGATQALLSDFFFNHLRPFDTSTWERDEEGPRDGTLEALSREGNGAQPRLELRGVAQERGFLSLGHPPAEWHGMPRRGARLRVLSKGHELGWMDIPLPVGPFWGAIDIPSAKGVPNGDQVLKSEPWRAARSLVEGAARELAQQQFSAWRESHGTREALRDVTRWTLDLERVGSGPWEQLARDWQHWQSQLRPGHPLRVEPR